MNEDSTSTDDQDIGPLRARIADLERALSASEQRERELRDDQARYRAVLDWDDSGVWEWHLVEVTARLSPGWFRVLGYEPDEIPNSAGTWLGLMHPDDKSVTSAAFKAYVEGRSPVYDVEHRMLHKAGKSLWIRTRGRIYERDAEGRPVRMIGTITDVTRQREAEAELRRSQSMLHSLVDNSPAIMIVRDLDWRFILINQEAESVLGLDKKTNIGKHDYEVVSQRAIEVSRATDNAVIEKGESVSSESVIPRAGERRSYVHIKFPIRDGQGKLIAIGGISTDITERKRAEEERMAMQERVIAAQTAAIRELSTPLLPISGDVVVMPLIGTIDSQRAQQLIEALLRGVIEHRAATVILDVTGIHVVDAEVASALVKASKAVRLLGADVVLTGIRPEVAQALVSIGADLGAIVVHGTLRSGIAYALGQGGEDRAYPRSRG